MTFQIKNLRSDILLLAYAPNWGRFLALPRWWLDNLRLDTLQVGRMTLYRWLAIAFASSLMVANVSAQSKKSFTINDLISISLESSPQILAARDQAKAIKGKLSTARAIPNPEFEVSAGQQRSATGPLTVGNVSSWAVTQPLDMPYTRFPRVNAAEANLRAAEATRVAFEVETISSVQQRFYELMRREAEHKAAEEDMSLTKQIRDRMQIRYDVGETARFECKQNS